MTPGDTQPAGSDLEVVERSERPPATECGAQAPGVAWDAQAAIYAALRTSGPLGSPARHALGAGLALRLAEQGYIAEVSFTVANGTPLDAIRLALAEVTPEAAPDPADALVSVREACAEHARSCLECGKAFEVNRRHAPAHKFCSPACRSRHRHRASKQAA